MVLRMDDGAPLGAPSLSHQLQALLHGGMAAIGHDQP